MNRYALTNLEAERNAHRSLWWGLASWPGAGASGARATNAIVDTARWIFVDEAALLLDVSTVRVYQLCKAERLRCKHEEGRLLIDEDSVLNFQRRKPGRPRRRSV